MPPRPQPKIHQILIKTHKTTIALSGITPNTTINQLKLETLDALTSDVAEDLLMTMSLSSPAPLNLESPNDFELCRQDKDKGKPTGTYSVLDPGRQIREHGLAGWEVLVIQFRKPETREFLPITCTLPSIDDDEDDNMEPPSEPTLVDSSKGKGKRKAEFSDDDSD